MIEYLSANVPQQESVSTKPNLPVHSEIKPSKPQVVHPNIPVIQVAPKRHRFNDWGWDRPIRRHFFNPRQDNYLYYDPVQPIVIEKKPQNDYSLFFIIIIIILLVFLGFAIFKNKF